MLSRHGLPALRLPLPINVRTMMWVVLAIAVALGSLASRARTQHIAVERVRQIGGQCLYDNQALLSSATSHPSWKSRWLEWSSKHGADDFFNKVTIVNLNGKKASDADLAFVGTFSDLQELYLVRTQISDDGLAHLSRLTKLRKLVLDGTAITDKGLAYLVTLKGLKTLTLRRTSVTPTGRDRLERILSLKIAY